MRRTHNNCRHYRRFSFLHVMSWRCPAYQKARYDLGTRLHITPKLKMPLDKTPMSLKWILDLLTYLICSSIQIFGIIIDFQTIRTCFKYQDKRTGSCIEGGQPNRFLVAGFFCRQLLNNELDTKIWPLSKLIKDKKNKSNQSVEDARRLKQRSALQKRVYCVTHPAHVF